MKLEEINMGGNYVSSRFNIIDFLTKAVAVGASDAHLQVDEHPAVRIDGKIYICVFH